MATGPGGSSTPRACWTRAGTARWPARRCAGPSRRRPMPGTGSRFPGMPPPARRASPRPWRPSPTPSRRDTRERGGPSRAWRPRPPGRSKAATRPARAATGFSPTTATARSIARGHGTRSRGHNSPTGAPETPTRPPTGRRRSARRCTPGPGYNWTGSTRGRRRGGATPSSMARARGWSPPSRPATISPQPTSPRTAPATASPARAWRIGTTRCAPATAPMQDGRWRDRAARRRAPR